MRGGGTRRRVGARRRAGRSPHARGRPVYSAQQPSGWGSIPACAGEAFTYTQAARQAEVDPRMRGGGWINGKLDECREGRSPHARGRLDTVKTEAEKIRSIPACAGEAVHLGTFVRLSGVDPRMRGGGENCFSSIKTLAGRSPHARGRLFPQGGSSNWIRSIPACAGEARSFAMGGVNTQVDPRMRGGGTGCGRYPVICRGRSPHARGRRRPGSRGGGGARSIPACAGEALSGDRGTWESQVDPRMRGGGRSFAMGGVNVQGRSPHARGRQ